MSVRLFRGVPSFAPEILRRVKIDDSMKQKKLPEIAFADIKDYQKEHA